MNMNGKQRMRLLSGAARLGVHLLASACVATMAGQAMAEKPLNPKDALAPVFRENPKQADPKAELSRLRNEGIAHYEGGITLDKAVASFEGAYHLGRQPVDAINMALVFVKQNKLADARAWTEKALQGNPDFPAAQYVMGLIEKLDGRADAARVRWTRTNELHPTDANLHYELAMLSRADKDEHGFLQELLRALQLDPEHKSSLYQMYRYYQGAGNKEMAAASLKRFNIVKTTEKYSRKDRPLDESEFTKPLRDNPQDRSAGFSFIDSNLGFEVVLPRADCAFSQVTPVTVVSPPAREDVLGVCADGRILRVEGGKASPLGSLDAPAAEVRVDWFDGQGPRIVAVGSSGTRLSSPLDRGPLRFEPLDDKPARRVLLADFDHDGDLDILTDASGTPLTNFEGKFKQQPAAYANSALAQAFKGDASLRVADLRRRGMADLVAVHGPDAQLLTDGADGHREGGRLHLSDTGDVAGIELADLDNDGMLDLVAAAPGGVSILWGGGRVGPPSGTGDLTRLAAGGAAPVRVAVADINNDGRRDLVVVDPAGTASVFLNTGPRTFETRPLGAVPAPGPTAELFAFDENRDGLTDIGYLDASGGLVVLRNASRNVGGSIDVMLNGKRSPATGHLSQVEVRKGHLYAYAQAAGGLVHLGLGREPYAEVVRLEWPNGFVENKIKVDATKEPYTYEESERIAGSCPVIFVRTAEGFRYVTDALISTAIGILQERGRYFGFGDREHQIIPPSLMVETDGRLDIRLTEELRETTYIDRASLLAVDHPAGARLGSTERLAPPSPVKTPFYAARRLVPAARASSEGQDLTEVLAHRDQRYADIVKRTRNPGFAQPSVIELDLGEDVDPGKVDAVYATGWFHAFDSTAVIGAFQGESPDFQWPELQERIGGEWHRAGYIGIPTGQNKTAVLTLQEPLKSRQLRVVSGFSVYWDEIAFSIGGEAPVQVTELPLDEANLRFHGFSGVLSSEPEVFDYENVDYRMIWSPMPGRFTNYGPVDALVGEKDGKYAVFGSGDEIAFSFRAPATPPAPGYERSFVLVLDGHVKDADRYTARSEAVEPMPRLGMSGYPPVPGHSEEQEDLDTARTRQRIGLDFTLNTLAPSRKEANHDE